MKTKIIVGAMLAAGALQAPSVFAQSSVTLYGVLDTYVGFQSATVGGKSTNLTVLGSNGLSTSRWGLRGTEDLGGGYSTRFDLESGFDPSTGAQQNQYRLFDRQAWVSVASPYGELRMGRQQSAMWFYSGNLDAFGSATYASGYNNFAQWLARVDNDISYFTPKFYNTVAEIHYSMGGRAGDFPGNSVFQLGVQSNQGPLYLAAAYLDAANATNTTRVKQFMAGGHYDYGHGKAYVGFFRTNEVISATTGNALGSPGGKYDPAVGPVGNTPGNYHNTYSISADYRINVPLTVAAGYAYIRDSSALHNNAEQFSLMTTYTLSKRTTLYADASFIKNQNSAQFKMSDAATTTGTFLTPDKGKNEKGLQVGIRHLF